MTFFILIIGLAAVGGYFALKSLKKKKAAKLTQEALEVSQEIHSHVRKLNTLLRENPDLPAETASDVALSVLVAKTTTEAFLKNQGHPPVENPQAIFPLVEQVVENKQKQLGKASRINFESVVDLKAKTARALVDSVRFEQTLSHLLDSRIESAPYGTITIVLSLKQQKICLNVIDSGNGIPKEHLGDVFDAELRWVQETIQSWSGTIEVTSVLGKGTTFSIWLPIA